MPDVNRCLKFSPARAAMDAAGRLRISTNNALCGCTNNPWNLDLVAGGSSGGEGAALASGMTPFGLGGAALIEAACGAITPIDPVQR